VTEGVELQWKKKDGEQIVVSLYARAIRNGRGSVVGYEGMVLDVTARKRAEEALRASEERYRNLFENANDMIATFTLDAIITGVNRGLEVTLGWFREELIGQHYSKLATPAALALANERTQRALAGEELPSIFEAEIVRKDGRVLPIEVRSRFMRNAAGQPIGVQGIFRDLTERKQAEAAVLTERAQEPVLTQREREVLRLLVAGKSNKAIKAALFLSTSTVKAHLVHILHKLGVNNRTQAVTVALKRGLVRLE
jgi:PAS domain S-box-containing protein